MNIKKVKISSGRMYFFSSIQLYQKTWGDSHGTIPLNTVYLYINKNTYHNCLPSSCPAQGSEATPDPPVLWRRPESLLVSILKQKNVRLFRFV